MTSNENLVVNSSADVINANDGVLTLREAINTANAKLGSDRIIVNADTINLNPDLGSLNITEDLQITGAAIRGGGPSFDVFTVNNGASLVLENANISGAQDAIQVENGNLTLLNSTLENNQDDAIDFNSSNGKLTVNNVLIRNNGVAEVASLGVGIEVDGSNNDISITNVTITGNEATGISIDGANNNITLSSAALENNAGLTQKYSESLIYLTAKKPRTLLFSQSLRKSYNGGSGITVGLENTAAGSNTLTISNSSFTGNSFDGIFAASDNNQFDLRRVTLNNNSDGIDIEGNGNGINLRSASVSFNQDLRKNSHKA